jgi:hypothetical protein
LSVVIGDLWLGAIKTIHMASHTAANGQRRLDAFAAGRLARDANDYTSDAGRSRRARPIPSVIG